MQSHHAVIENQLVAQVVRTREFKKLITLPVFAWQHITLISTVYVVVLGGMFLYLEGVIPYLLLLVTAGLARAAAFTPLHDATHDSVSSNPRVNDFLGALSAQMLFPGINTQFYRFLHLEHHRHTGDEEKDPDESTGSPDPFKRWRTVLFFDLHLAFWFLKHRHRVPRKDRIINYITLAIFTGFHVGFLVSPYAMEFLLLWVLPTRVGIAFVTYLFASIQHPPGVLQSERPLQATRMVSDSPFWRHFTLGQSEHLMHHMFPRVPFYNYHSVWQLSKDLFSRRELVWSAPFPMFSKAGRTMPSPELDNSPLTIAVVIDAIESVSDEVKSYTFRSLDGQPLPDYKPGAHIDVHIDEGLIRQYSLTGLSRPGTYNIGVKCEEDGRGGSKTLHQTFAKEQTIAISYPRNLFELQPQQTPGQGHAHLVAGGIGITPLLSMAETLQEQGRDFTFHVCARALSFQPFADYLKQAFYADKVKMYLDSEGQAIQASDLTQWQPGDDVYMCGPAGFMNFVSGLATEQGFPESDIHFEHFSAGDNQAHENKAFTVTLARSGKHFTVSKAETLLDALQKNGVTIAASCMQGVCGTCQCKALKGDIEHRDAILTDDQKQQGVLTACVSRADGDLVIDA